MKTVCFFLLKRKKMKALLLLFIVVVFILFSFLMLSCDNTSLKKTMDYDSSPQRKVTDEELIGTWELKNHLVHHNVLSLIILKRDGIYEIHNPPSCLENYCEPKPDVFESPTCKTVITGKWINGRWKPGIEFKGIYNFGPKIQGATPPYQLWYSEISPDITPLYIWEKTSTQTTCPMCPADAQQKMIK